jgi:hypothetical protein
VRVVAGNCANTSDEVVLTGETGFEFASKIELFPNPASERIAIHVTKLPGARECVATIYNTLGEKVAQKILDYQSEGFQAELVISHLAAGRYIVQITDGQQKCSKTFIKL